MKPLLCVFFITLSLPSSAATLCHYAGAFESVRLNVDYDPIFGDSDLSLSVVFQSEGGEDLGVWDDRPRLTNEIAIPDSQLGKYIDIKNKKLFPFEKGSGKIKISTLVDEIDYAFPRFLNHPMRLSRTFDPNNLEWKPSAMDEYDQFATVLISNKKVDLKLALYRSCDFY